MADMSNKPIGTLGELTNVKFPDIFVEPLISRANDVEAVLLIPRDRVPVEPI